MSDRENKIDAEVQELASKHQILPEEVSVFDIENVTPIEHNWSHYGLLHICNSPTHPRHQAMSKA